MGNECKSRGTQLREISWSSIPGLVKGGQCRGWKLIARRTSIMPGQSKAWYLEDHFFSERISTKTCAQYHLDLKVPNKTASIHIGQGTIKLSMRLSTCSTDQHLKYIRS